MSVKQIIEGWRNHVLPAKHTKEYLDLVSKARLSICEQCEHHSKNHNTMRPDAHCTHCGCTLAAKTKCLSCKCPIDKWVEEEK